MIPGQSSPTTTMIAWLLVNPGIARRLKRMANIVSLNQMAMIMCQNRIQPNSTWSVPHTSVRSYFHDWKSIIFPLYCGWTKAKDAESITGTPDSRCHVLKGGAEELDLADPLIYWKFPRTPWTFFHSSVETPMTPWLLEDGNWSDGPWFIETGNPLYPDEGVE